MRTRRSAWDQACGWSREPTASRARITENACGDTWPNLRRDLDRIAVGTFTGPAGTFRQRTEICQAQAAILSQLGIGPPPKIYQLTPATTG